MTNQAQVNDLLRRIMRLAAAGKDFDETDYASFAENFPEDPAQQVSLVAYLTVRNGVLLTAIQETLESMTTQMDFATKQRTRIWIALGIVTFLSVLGVALHTEVDIVTSLVASILSSALAIVVGVVGGKQ